MRSYSGSSQASWTLRDLQSVGILYVSLLLASRCHEGLRVTGQGWKESLSGLSPGLLSSWASSEGTVVLSSLGPGSSKPLLVVGRPIRSAHVCRKCGLWWGRTNMPNPVGYFSSASVLSHALSQNLMPYTQGLHTL